MNSHETMAATPSGMLRIVPFAAWFWLSMLATAPLPGAELPRIAAFCCNITPPLGQPMISRDRLGMVEQPLLAKGVVLESAGRRYVLCALDWCELCNGAHDSFCTQLAAAAHTEPACVAVQTLHQHTAPLVDMDAQKLLAAVGHSEMQIDPRVFSAAEHRVADTVREAITQLTPFDRVGAGQAKVERVASSRRPKNALGKIAVRSSYCGNAATRALPEGEIDPFVKTITFAYGNKPLARLHYYATHPQTRYGDGRASSDMVGDAREALQQREGVFQVYFTGCGGDVTVGKYNDGTPQGRAALAERLLGGMQAAIAATKYEPAGPLCWRTYPLVLAGRTIGGVGPDACRTVLANSQHAEAGEIFNAAIRLAYHQRSARPIVLNSLQIGRIHIVHLPGEPLIAYQLFAQQLKPDAFVAVAGYGDEGTGYLCTEQAVAEGGYEPRATRVSYTSEPAVKKAIAALLGRQ